MFEYIITAFKVIVGLFTPERLVLTACVVFGVFVLWILFSLLFSFQSKFSRGCRKISLLVDTYGLTSEVYPKFIELGSKLPDSFLRGWKTFEHSGKGLPSEFIKRADCLDLELNGGLFNQNRSTMKTFISGFAIFFALIGLGNTGADLALTGYALAEALLIPFIFSLLSILAYYLYTAIRQHQYRVCVEDFNEMMDILNEKVENSEIEFANKHTEMSEFVKNVVDPSPIAEERIVIVNDKSADVAESASLFVDEPVLENVENTQIGEFTTVDVSEMEDDVASDEDIYTNVSAPSVDDNKVEVDNAAQGSVAEVKELNSESSDKESEPVALNEIPALKTPENEEKEKGESMDQEIMPVAEKKRGRGRPKKEKAPEGELIIKSDEEFEEVLARAEKLMKKNEEPLSASQQKRIEKALKELVDAMKKYKGEM